MHPQMAAIVITMQIFIHNAHPVNILRNSVGVQPFSALNTLMKVDGFAKPDCIAASVTDILGSARKVRASSILF